MLLQRDNDLPGRHALPLNIKPRLDKFETLAHDLRLRRSNIRPLCQSAREEIHINRLADFVVEERGAEDETGPDAPRFRLDPNIRHARYAGGGEGQEGEPLRRPLRHGERRHGDVLGAFALVEDVEAVFGRAGTDGEGTRGGFAFECVDDVFDDGFAVVVEGLAGAELFEQGEILRRACGDYFVAGCDGELDGVAADARGAAPDK